ncbi:hypothetical protein E4T47_06277, partial [Aureobasidium subglaciale]
NVSAQHHATPAQQNVSAQHHTTPAQQNVSAQHHATPAQQNVSAQSSPAIPGHPFTQTPFFPPGLTIQKPSHPAIPEIAGSEDGDDNSTVAHDNEYNEHPVDNINDLAVLKRVSDSAYSRSFSSRIAAAVNLFEPMTNAPSRRFPSPHSHQKRVIIPASIKTYDVSTLPHELFDLIRNYLEPRDIINLALSGKKGLASVAEPTGHFVSVASGIATSREGALAGKWASKKPSAHLNEGIAQWAFFNSVFLDGVWPENSELVHIIVQRRNGQQFVGIDGYAGIRSLVDQQAVHSVRRLTLAGPIHISAEALIWLTSKLEHLRDLVVSHVPSIDPAVSLTYLVPEYGDRLKISFAPVMPAEHATFRFWYGYRYAYFGGLYFQLLPLAKVHMPTLLQPGSALHGFFVRTFSASEDQQTRVRELMDKLYILNDKSIMSEVDDSDSSLSSSSLNGDVEALTFADQPINVKDWVKSNKEYIRVAGELIEIIRKKWGTETTHQDGIFICKNHGVVFGLFASEAQRTKHRNKEDMTCWLDAAEESYREMKVFDSDAKQFDSHFKVLKDEYSAHLATVLPPASTESFAIPMIEGHRTVATNLTIDFDNTMPEPTQWVENNTSTVKHVIIKRQPPKIRLEPFDRSKQVLAIDSLPDRRVVNEIVAKVAESAEDSEDLKEADVDSMYSYMGSDCSSINELEQVPVNKYIDDTFADRAEYDGAIHSLKKFCPVSLSHISKVCPHRDRCALEKVCHFNPSCRKDDCKFSHEVVVTCPFMLRKGHCSRKDCRYNHDHEVRSIIQMFAKEHVDGLYGLIEGESSAEAGTAQINETSVEV